MSPRAHRLSSSNLRGCRLLDRYDVLDVIARGGMSFVYSAHDSRLQRAVCVKVLHTYSHGEHMQSIAYDHFVQEALALSRLRHPNTVRIFDFGYLEEPDLSPFYVCELLDGGTLSERLTERGPCSVDETLEIVSRIAEALDEVHAHDIVHRDVKPSNIMFSRAGAHEIVKLTDFSIAKSPALHSDAPASVSRTFDDTDSVAMLSSAWAAPEQFRRQRVGPETDAFALGMVTLAMLIGGSIFPRAEQRSLLRLRAQGEDWLFPAIDGLGLHPPIARAIKGVLRDARDARPGVLAFAASLRDAALEPARTATSVVRESSVRPRTSEDRTGGALTWHDLTQPLALGGGRSLIAVPIHDAITLGEREDPVLEGFGARVRVSPVHGPDRSLQLHVKGLNCFVARERPTTALNVQSDDRLRFVATDGRPLDELSIHFGVRQGGAWILTLPATTVVVSVTGCSWMTVLDAGPTRDALLLYRLARGTTP